MEKYFSALPELEITILANASSYAAIRDQFSHLNLRVLLNALEVQRECFDLAVNLSLVESSWKLLEDVQTRQRRGIYYEDGLVKVSDHWATYLLTLKSQVPFLSFHLEEIYKNILGAGQSPMLSADDFKLEKFIFSLTDSSLFPAGEQEALLNLISKKFSGIPILDISEADPNDRDGVFYLGPATLHSATMNYPRNLFIQKIFQGTNLLPTSPAWILTSRDKVFSAQEVFGTLEHILDPAIERPENVSLYLSRYDEEGDSFVEQISGSEITYPIYLAYFVLWNFVLGLRDSEPAFPKIHGEQKEFLKIYLEILKKISRFHTYALASLDILLKEGKNSSPDTDVVDGHLENLRQIDETLRKISDSHPMLRPLLDFYHIRRGQNDGKSFREQVENSLLTYHEEHQAFTAFEELLQTLERR